MKTDCRFSPRLLWEYEEGLLDERRRAEVERHLSECEACRTRAASDRELFAKVRNQRPLAAPETARLPKWEAKPSPTPMPRWRWAVTVAGLAVLAFVAFGVFWIAGEHGPAPPGTALQQDAAIEPPGTTETAPAPAYQSGIAEKRAADTRASVPGAASPPELERGRQKAQPSPEPRVSLGRDDELPQPKSSLRVEAGEGTETRTSPPGTAGSPPKEVYGGASLGGPRGGAGGGFRASADKAQFQAVVAALTDDGKVVAVAEMDAANHVSIREQDGTKLSFDLGNERKWPGRPEYLDRLITLSETGSLGVLANAISHQASVPLEVKEAAQSQVLTVQLSEVQLGLALANIALACETEWKAEKDRVVISPLWADDVAMAKAGRGTQEQATTQRTRLLTQQLREGNLVMQQTRSTDTECPWCGRPHLGPLWRYCPFCGQPLKGKP